MPHYRAETLVERLLERLSGSPGYVGRSSTRKLRRRFHKRALVAFTARLARLKPGDVCLDLGANIGTYTQLMARTGAEVHAYEPDPETFAVLTANMRPYPNVILHQQAVGATAGTVTLHRVNDTAGPFEKRSQGSTILHETARMDPAKSVLVEKVAFRAVLDGLRRPAALVKMDIEGAEVEILAQMRLEGRTDGFDEIYVETHERQYPELAEEIARIRAWAEAIAQPQFHLHWR